VKDKDNLFTFYDFPGAHWIHIRTTNPIEFTFATVRNRTRRTKGSGSRIATLTMVFKLALEAQKTWKKLKGYPLLFEDKKFIDGELKEEIA
jgi:putative transposase